MRQGHHHGPHLGHRPWPRRGVGAVLARGGVGECRRVPCEELGPWAALGAEHCAHGGRRLAACLLSCHNLRSGTGTPTSTPDDAEDEPADVPYDDEPNVVVNHAGDLRALLIEDEDEPEHMPYDDY